jgi:WS/DGAT/MGAT family acyltransferase
MAIDRASPVDLTSLAVDRGNVPMHIGALIGFDPAAAPAADALAAVIGERMGTVPRLTQRLVDTPFGCGRPVWADDPDFEMSRHLAVICDAQFGAAGSSEALHRTAVEVVLRRLPRDRPLWRAALLADPTGRVSALVLVMHHVLADGMGGLAVLASLVDGLPPANTPSPGAAALPDRRALARDAWSERARAAKSLPRRARGAWSGLRELDVGVPKLAGRSSLLASTSSQRRIDVVDVDLARVQAAARAVDATLNDVVLVAVSGALRDLLARRGESLRELVVSVPVSARRSTTAGELGNAVGVLPITIPLVEDPAARLRAVTTRRARLGVAAPRGSSSTAMSLVFRGLASVGLFDPFIRRQRLVHTFETNLRGPRERLSIAGCEVTRVVPIAVNPGNVTVSFDVLSLAGRLVVTVVSDPERVPDHQDLASLLEEHLLR